MGFSARSGQSIRNDRRVEIGLVQVDICTPGKQEDHYATLVLKQAKEVLKDTLVTYAESKGGSLSSWQDDIGTFLFLIEGPESYSTFCLAALELLEQFPAVKQDAQLPPDLERQILLRIICDTRAIPCGSEEPDIPDDILIAFKTHKRSMSVENQVTITERIYRHLHGPLQSAFVRWKHCPELGVDLYFATRIPAPMKLRLAHPDSVSTQVPSVEGPAAQAAPPPSPAPREAPASGWRKQLSDAVRAPKTRKAALVTGLMLVLAGLLWWIAVPKSPPRAPASHLPPLTERVQSEEWRTWRNQVHEKLSAGKVTESTLADVLHIKLNVHPEHAPAALRQDQAIADVLMSYPDVRDILKKRFGIYEDTFLGTGLSKPYTSPNYGAASVHEYLIENYPDNHPRVWIRILDPTRDQQELHLTVEKLFDGERTLNEQQKQLVKGIKERVQEKDMTSPAVIRFAILDTSKYSRKLGRNDAYRVFVSNLAEVWDKNVREAARLSGHTFNKGDSLYVWAFLPNHSEEVIPATWGEVLIHLPQWLSDNDRR